MRLWLIVPPSLENNAMILQGRILDLKGASRSRGRVLEGGMVRQQLCDSLSGLTNIAFEKYKEEIISSLANGEKREDYIQRQHARHLQTTPGGPQCLQLIYCVCLRHQQIRSVLQLA